jgi:phage-related protein (TIGR01555 family)
MSRKNKKYKVKDAIPVIPSTPERFDKDRINDNLVNVMTKAAIRHRDVTNPANNFYENAPALDYNQLENIYITSWVAKKIVDLPIDYMFKNGFEINIDGENNLEKEAMDYYKKNKLEIDFKLAIRDKKRYGGAVLFPKDRFQNPMVPYNWEAFKDRDIEFIFKDFTYVAVTPYTDVVSRRYFDPKVFNMAGVTMLAENCLQFRGVQVPKRRMPPFRYMGMSVYQNIFQAMIADEYISKGIVNMVYRNNMKYYKLYGFDETVKQGGDDLILARMALMEDSASIMSAGLLDAKDDVSFVSQAFSELANIDQRSLSRLAAASNIPSMLLMGRSPEHQGLNSNDSGEMELIYNYIEQEQADESENGARIFQIICYILAGKKYEIEFKFNKPYNVNPQKQVEKDKLVLENMTAQQAIGIPDEIIIDYGVRNGILTTEQATKVTELKNEMMEMAEFEAENAEKQIQSKTDSPKE